jgi:hypothetical protein
VSRQRTMGEALGVKTPPVAEIGRAVGIGPSVLWETVTYLDGDLGDRLETVRIRLRREARALGLVVREFKQSPARVAGFREVPHGLDNLKQPTTTRRRECEITVVAELGPAPPERWVRLTSDSGPCAVEVLTTEAGTVKERREYHPEDVRSVAWGHAQQALEETAVGGR